VVVAVDIDCLPVERGDTDAIRSTASIARRGPDVKPPSFAIVLAYARAGGAELITPGGNALSKADYLGAVASGAIDYQVWEPDSPIEVRLYGLDAVIRYRSHIEIVGGGRKISGHYWHTDSYEKRVGRWQVVWSQATEIQPR
jgi:hypothetical protein